MNAMLSSMRRHYITRLGLSLLIVALIAGLTGCVGEASRTVKYDLTIASGAGGSVTDPGQGTFKCDAGRVLELVATPTSGYRFLKWTGSVATIANPNAASTTITMSGNYSIRATFEETEATFHTLTVGVTGSGSTSPTVGQHTYAAGAVISISATPAGGYHFVNWTGNVGTVANVNAASTTITMNGNYSITANFQQAAATYYTLTMAATGGGSANPAVGQHSYAAGTVVPIIATATGGYYFVNWTGNVGTIANVNAASTTIIMNGNYSITANFAVIPPGQYTLTMAANPVTGGTTTPIGITPRANGTVVNIQAVAAAGYRFVNWTAVPGVTFGNATAAATNFTMPSNNVTVTANFESDSVPPVPWNVYNLTMVKNPVAGGTTTPAGITPYANGTVVNITASANPGYVFVNWTAVPGVTLGNATAAVTAFTMPAQNVTVTANFIFVAAAYNLTMAANPGVGGTTTPTGTNPYTAGTVVNITASANSGYRFDSWTAVPGVTFGNATATATSFTMPSNNVTVTAKFVAAAGTYNLTVVANPVAGGTTTPTGITPYANGTVVNIIASANSGYVFVNWTAVPGVAFGNATAAATGFTMPAQNIMVTANFAVIQPGQYSLTISSTAGGSVTTPGEGTFTRNASAVVSLAASPDTDYRFVSWVGDVSTVGNLRAASTSIAMNGNYRITALFAARFMTAAGERHTVGLKSDGTLVAVGDNSLGQRNVDGWTSIIQVAAGNSHTVGLKSDGTMIAVGDNSYGQCNVGTWTNIIQVAAGAFHTVGLRSDGTVVAVGDNSYGQRDIGAWTNIVQVAAGGYHTVGLKSDGTVIPVGPVGAGEWPDYGQCNVGNWTGIVQVAAGDYHTVGLKSDGTVIAAGYNYHGQCNIGGWTSIIQVAAGAFHTVGLRSGGTMVAVGDNYDQQLDVSSWTNIVQVSAGDYHTVGLKFDGTVVAVGANWWGQCYVGGWDLN
jgi:hypothetical protein